MKLIKILFLFILVPSVLMAQIDSTDIIIKKMMEQQKITGLSLAVVKDGKIISERFYY